MKIQLFLFIFFACCEILYASDIFAKGSELIYAWSFMAIFSFLGLFFVIYGLFSSNSRSLKTKNVGTPTFPNSQNRSIQDENRKIETFGKKEEEIFLNYSEKMERYKTIDSITLHFFKGENLTPAYIKKRGIFIVPTEFRPLEHETMVIEKLLNKEGVFNIDHSSFFLPLADENKLYGAVEFRLESPRTDFQISTIWNDTKEFTKDFLRLHSYNYSQKDTDSGMYNSENFWDVLRMKSKEKAFENLTLIRFFNCNDLTFVASILKSNLVKIFGEDFKIYRLYDSTFGFFLGENEISKFQSVISEILSDFHQYDPNIHFSVGASDKNLIFSSSLKWFKKSENALEESALSGMNHYKHFSLK